MPVVERRRRPHPCIDCGQMVGWGLARCIDCADRAGGNLSYEAKELSRAPLAARRRYVMKHDVRRLAVRQSR